MFRSINITVLYMFGLKGNMVILYIYCHQFIGTTDNHILTTLFRVFYHV